jgi:L-fuculose-phosphate aldolase
MNNVVSKARKLYSGLPTPEWSFKQKLALSARILAQEGHGGTLSGQISCRDSNENMGDTSEEWDGTMYTQVYGVPLEKLEPQSFIKINSDLEVVEGNGFPNLANRFHLHVYRNRPDIQCVIHTHPPASTVLAMTGQPLHIGNMDTMGLYDQVGHLPTWPGVPFGDEEGEIISNVMGKDNWAALLGHHGMIVGGKSIEEATYRAVFFEKAAAQQLQLMAAMNGEPFPQVDKATAERAREWRMNPGPCASSFQFLGSTGHAKWSIESLIGVV